MFFTSKDKAALQHHIECLYRDIRFLTGKLEVQTIRIDALMKAYPHGTTRTGEQRKKPGRKPKVQA